MSRFDWKPGRVSRIRAGGRMLEAEAHGPPPDEASTIVMLHEGLGCRALWRDFPARLSAATGWGVFVWSRAGYGRSDPADLPFPIDYMTREAEGPLPEILDATGFRRGVLLGHSDGATIAALHAGGVADMRVRGLILMAPHFFTEPMGLAEIARARTAFETTDMRARMAKYHDDPEASFRGWNDAWMNPAFASWNVADCIDYLRIPTLAIQGRDDAYGTLAQIEELENRSYAPVDVAVLDDCGHSPHLDQPRATLDAAADFIARLARMEAAPSPVSGQA